MAPKALAIIAGVGPGTVLLLNTGVQVNILTKTTGRFHR